MKRTFSREELNRLGLPSECDGGEILVDRILSKDRWAYTSELVWRMPDGSCWRTTYRSAATESQEQDPWGWAKEIEAVEVVEVDRLVTFWEPKEEADKS